MERCWSGGQSAVVGGGSYLFVVLPFFQCIWMSLDVFVDAFWFELLYSVMCS